MYTTKNTAIYKTVYTKPRGHKHTFTVFTKLLIIGKKIIWVKTVCKAYIYATEIIYS